MYDTILITFYFIFSSVVRLMSCKSTSFCRSSRPVDCSIVVLHVENLYNFTARGARAMLLGGGDLGRVRAMMPQRW